MSANSSHCDSGVRNESVDAEAAGGKQDRGSFSTFVPPSEQVRWYRACVQAIDRWVQPVSLDLAVRIFTSLSMSR